MSLRTRYVLVDLETRCVQRAEMLYSHAKGLLASEHTYYAVSATNNTQVWMCMRCTRLKAVPTVDDTA